MSEGGEAPFGRGRTARQRAGAADFVAGHSIAKTDWRPHDYQAPLLAIDKGVILAAGALGSGKSEPGAEQLIRWAFRYPRRKDGRPSRWYVIGPDYSLVKLEQFGKLLDHLRKVTVPGFSSIVKRVVAGGSDPRIILAQDQVIIGRSATDPDRLRGHEVDGFWGDEVQKWPEKAFRVGLSRLRSASATRVVLTGSPEDSPGWVWRMLSGQDAGYNKLRKKLLDEGSGFYGFRWTSAQNTANESGVLGVVRAGLEASADGVAAQELEGRFPGTPEAPQLGLVEYAKAFLGTLRLSPADEIPDSLGIDVGEIDDFTWFSVVSRSGVVLHMERWNAGSPGVPRAEFYPYLERRARDVAERWRVPRVVVDTAKAGKPVQQSLERELRGRIVVIGVDTAIPMKKSEIIEGLTVGLAKGDTRIPSLWTGSDGREHPVDCVPQLRKEFEELVVFNTPQGRRKYDHPRGGHDDGIVSLSLANFGRTRQPPPPNLSGWGTIDLGGPRRFA